MYKLIFVYGYMVLVYFNQLLTLTLFTQRSIQVVIILLKLHLSQSLYQVSQMFVHWPQPTSAKFEKKVRQFPRV